jgi:Zn-finger nucleic acid-binding protein
MNCALCKIELKKYFIKNIEVDECEKCKGIWFEDDELRKAKDSTDEDLNWMDFEIWKHKDKFKIKSRNISCPKCNQLLVTINYDETNIEIDYCPTCRGTWLDKGEFKKIIENLTNELLTKSFSEYVISSLEEAKEIITGNESFVSEWKDFSTVLRMMQYRLFVENPKLLDRVVQIQKYTPFK